MVVLNGEKEEILWSSHLSSLIPSIPRYAIIYEI